MQKTSDWKKGTLMISLFDVLNRLPTHTSNHQACVLHPHTHCQSSPTEYWRCCSDNHIISCSLNSLAACLLFPVTFLPTGQLVFAVLMLCLAEIKSGLTQTATNLQRLLSRSAPLSYYQLLTKLMFGRRVTRIQSLEQISADRTVLYFLTVQK